ncbi:MAG: filamentous hemagglutinin N-terminal domain-containing protein, partial [Gammaproteobacteria bacterium]|nr:filamentous hemagglutinin N-terminal domain-containing protein [Gammaproteobacteria bacterium]
MKILQKGNFKLSSAIRRSILPVASGIAACSPFFAVDVIAAPKGGKLLAGQASISQSSYTTNIHQKSNRAVLQWNSFNVGENEIVNFHQPSASSAILNRIIDQNPSQILGQINSKGQVFLINPNGIVFGKTARVNVGGIVASSLDVTTEDFMAGKYTFTNALKNKSSKIINKGLIKASSSGVILIGSNVMNEGKIYAKLGNVALVSANKVTVDFDGDGLIQFEVDKELIEKDKQNDREILNTGEIISEGGHVILTAQTSKEVFTRVVNNEGVIKATRVENRGGDVFLLGGNEGDIVNTGIIDVSVADIDGNIEGFVEDSVNQVAGKIKLKGKSIESTGSFLSDSYRGDGGSIHLEASKKIKVKGIVSAQGKGLSSKGGTVKVLGDEVLVKNKTVIDASGQAGGGEILIGGNFQGNDGTKTAKKTKIDKEVQIKSDAVASGDGGKIIVWSDDKTEFNGHVSAKGGQNFGDGGFVEVSGKKKLKFKGTVDTSSSNGMIGSLLLDPEYIKVAKDDVGVTIYPASSSWDNDTELNIPFDEALEDVITITKEQLENIKSDITLLATVGIEFEEFVINLEKNLTLETRNSLSHSDHSKSIDKIHGVDISKATINLANGGLEIKSGQNDDGDNDVSTKVKLGEINANKGVDVSSANEIITYGDIEANNDINLNSNTDSMIVDQDNGKGISIDDSGFNSAQTIQFKSNSGSVLLSGDLDGQNAKDLNIKAKSGYVSVDAIRQVKQLTVEADNFSINSDITSNSNLNLSEAKKINLVNDVVLESVSGEIDLSQGINKDFGYKSLDLRASTNIKLGESELKELSISAESLQILGDVTANESIDLSSVQNTNINTSIQIQSKNNDINLSKTELKGEQLTLMADFGDVMLENAELKSLSVDSNTAYLTGSIETRGLLDFNNVSEVRLSNSVELKSDNSN